MERYDIVVVGGGPAGVTAALRARELGASTALVERGRLGGTCTNDGCVPTRVLAKAARLLRDAAQFEDYGLMDTSLPRVDFSHVLARTRHVVDAMHEKKQLIDHLDDVGVATYTGVGNARFVDAHTLAFPDGRQIYGKRFVLAVGGSPRRLPIPGAEHILTHSDVWDMESLPDSVVIVGTGATGAQLASVFNAFGVDVTMLDLAPRILPGEDPDVSDAMEAYFEANGIDVITGIDGVDRVEADDDTRHVVYRMDGAEHAAETGAVLFAVGWPGNVDALNLQAAGVAVERGYIQTDETLRTSASHIYAAGDITGRMMLVQSASYQARLAVENAVLQDDLRLQARPVPHGGFTDPEYGGVGLTEAQANAEYDTVVASVPYADLDRAVIDGRTAGFFKLIVDRGSHRVLGAHAVGEQAVAVIQVIAAAMTGETTVDKLADMELAYPTFAAVVGLAARQIIRDLDAVPVAPQWRALHKARGTEWERQETV